MTKGNRFKEIPYQNFLEVQLINQDFLNLSRKQVLGFSQHLGQSLVNFPRKPSINKVKINKLNFSL